MAAQGAGPLMHLTREQGMTDPTPQQRITRLTGEQRGGGRMSEIASIPDSLKSAAHSSPPDWFNDPNFTEVTHVRARPDGRIFGHFTYWPRHAYETSAPRSPSGYKPFHRWDITVGGTGLRVGLLVERAESAPRQRFHLTSVEEIDASEGRVVAAVRVGEDGHGIWMVGRVSPHLMQSLADRGELGVSGHWVKSGPRSMELLDLMLTGWPSFPPGFVPERPSSGEEQTA